MTRAPVAAAVAATALLSAAAASPASAQVAIDPHVVVVRSEPTSLQALVDLLTQLGMEPGRHGGVGLLAHASRLDGVLDVAQADADLDVTVLDVAGMRPGFPAERFPPELMQPEVTVGQLWIVAAASTPDAGDLGVVAIVGGSGGGPGVPTLTSDSTRRDGVVVAEDVVPTMRALSGLADHAPGGAVIRSVPAPVPFSLFDRYVASRRMSVPIQVAAGVFVTAAGVAGVLLLGRRRAPRWLPSAAAWLVIAVVPLAVMLLVAGHVPRPTYPTVLGVVAGGTALGCVGAWVVARRRGTMSALAALGATTIAALVVEAALGWTAALTTYLGGSQLDGGRFYGLPNVEIGLLLGAGVFVAMRMPARWPGVALLAALSMFAGLPFAGANLGGAVTLGAGAGLWWAFRGARSAWAIAGAALLGALAGGACAVGTNTLFPAAPTHITSFVEGSGDGIVATALHRLGTGVDLIVRNPFALAPVVGLPLVLVAVLRPAPDVRASFERHPGWREALLTILWGGVVAYIANDTGAAALGLAFGTALAGLLFVSLRDRPWMMGAS